MRRSTRRVRLRFARTPATLTAASLASAYAIGAALHLAFGVQFVIGIGTVLTLVLPLIAAFVYTDAWRPRWPTQQLVERVRAGTHPIGTAYATLLLSACPVALFYTAVIGLDGERSFAPSLLTVFALCCLAGAARGPRHVAVDPSGVFVQRLLGWAHVPWRAITDVRLEGPRTIVIETRRDGAQKLELPANSLVDPSLLVQQLQQLRPPPSTIDPAHPRFSALDRSGRSRDAWLSAARALLTQQSLREAHLSVQDLQALIDHADTPPERRIAAAAALAEHDATAPARIRVAIEDCDDRATARELEGVLRAAQRA